VSFPSYRFNAAISFDNPRPTSAAAWPQASLRPLLAGDGHQHFLLAGRRLARLPRGLGGLRRRGGICHMSGIRTKIIDLRACLRDERMAGFAGFFWRRPMPRLGGVLCPTHQIYSPERQIPEYRARRSRRRSIYLIGPDLFRLPDGPGGYGFEAPREPLSQRPVPALGQGQEPATSSVRPRASGSVRLGPCGLFNLDPGCCPLAIAGERFALIELNCRCLGPNGVSEWVWRAGALRM
jgi:hypothetical protein